jgi:hypothetical protein
MTDIERLSQEVTHRSDGCGLTAHLLLAAGCRVWRCVPGGSKSPLSTLEDSTVSSTHEVRGLNPLPPP